MRASILVLVATGAHPSLPGGCAIGNRPIDLHLKVLEAFGAHIELAQGYVKTSAPDGLPGGEFDFRRVGRLSKCIDGGGAVQGLWLVNAAREPDVDLCNLLTAMGAEIEKSASGLPIHGVSKLHGATYRVMPDRIEAGSYACGRSGGGAARGRKRATWAPRCMRCAISEWRSSDKHGINVAANGPLKAHNLTTAPFPGLATDRRSL